ncbi:hypothetical protein FQN51_003146 [Onygenales sp. PD_10]|nr:hypothetical protein FQN51_003146 [Onygenales sp. PD_10]
MDITCINMDSKPPAYTRNEEGEYAGAEKTPEHLARGTSPSTTLTTQASTDAAFRTTFASLSLHRNDRIRLLGFSQEDVIGIETVIKQRWAKGIQVRIIDAILLNGLSSSQTDFLNRISDHTAPRALVLALGRKVQRSYTQGSAFEIKFNGYPWKANGTETVETRAILLILLNTLEQFGFSLYGSIQQDSKQGEEHVAVDTWFCNRQVNWTPGAPIYHG